MEDQTDMINIDDIKNADFANGTEPRDAHLVELLGLAYTGKITCRMAIADVNVIIPFSDFTPTPSEPFTKHFIEQAKASTPPPLYVYAKDGKLVMSDDYSSYALYKELKLPQAVCIVIGDSPALEGVEYHGEPFILQTPTLEVMPDE